MHDIKDNTFYKMHCIIKIISVVLVSILICTPLILISFAHPGRTDGAGGHYDHSTGKYHYHHGHSAHQHENGICPYESNGNSIAGTIFGIIICVLFISGFAMMAPMFGAIVLGIFLSIFKVFSAKQISDKAFTIVSYIIGALISGLLILRFTYLIIMLVKGLLQ